MSHPTWRRRPAVSHGNTLRALAAHLDRLGADELAGLRIRPGQLLVYRLTPDLRPLHRGGESPPTSVRRQT